MWLPSFFLLLVCTSIMAEFENIEHWLKHVDKELKIAMKHADGSTETSSRVKSEFEDIEHWLKHVDLKELKAAMKHAKESTETSAGVKSEFEDIEHCLKLVDLKELLISAMKPDGLKENICPAVLGFYDCVEKYVHESTGLSTEMFAAFLEFTGEVRSSCVKRFMEIRDLVKALCEYHPLNKGVLDEIYYDIQHCMEPVIASWTHSDDELKTVCLALRGASDCIDKLIRQSIGFSVEKFANFLEVKDEKQGGKLKSYLKLRDVIIKEICADVLQSNEGSKEGSKEDELDLFMDFLEGFKHCTEIAVKLKPAIKHTDGLEDICSGMLRFSDCNKKLIEKVNNFPVELLAQFKSANVLRKLQKNVDLSNYICEEYS